jgi:uncharacterized repeat protein (TIGR01451 family)/fimbrial isopeptide formation D2 family protein
MNLTASLFKGLARRTSPPQRPASRRHGGRRSLHAEWLERRLALAATPTASLSAPNGFIGSEIPLTVTFDNTGTDIGYGPFLDVIMPASGDAPPTPANGISYKPGSATYAGIALTPTVLTFGPSGQVNHPFAKDSFGDPVVISGGVGDQLLVFQLPFGSYGPAQPPATVNFVGTVSGLAQPGNDYDITATGGFQYQLDGSGNPTVDEADFGATATDPVEPQLFTLTKDSSAPEDETATGPNFQHTYTVTVSVAPGQSLENFTVTDVLPGNVQFVAVTSATANGGTVINSTLPSTTAPGGTLTYEFDQVVGTGGADVEIIYTFFMPEYTAGGADVIPLETGGTATATNTVGASGTWLNANPNFPPEQFVVGDPVSYTVTGKTLALQKSASPSANARAGDTVTYTLSFQLSDYFALGDFVIDDILSDGQDFDASFTPTLSFTQKGQTLTGTFGAGNFTVDDTLANGTTTVDFDVATQLAALGLATGTKIVGAGISNTGTGGPDPDPLPTDPGTTGTITFQTIIRNTYRATGDEVVQGDVIGNTASTGGTVLDFTDLDPTTSTFSDGSSASVTLATGELQKTVHAVNGVAVTGTPVVAPGDTVTFRLTYNLPFSSIGSYVLTDYLPLPIFEAGALTFDGGPSPTLPGAGEWSFGPLDTFSQPDPPDVGGPTPTFSFSTAANSVSWDFGTFQDDEDRSGVTDIFFTVTATARPFADGLFLTNQGVQSEVTTQGETLTTTDIAQVQVAEPLLGITKGVVATSDPNGVFTPDPFAPAGVTFDAPGSSPSFTGTVTSNGLATTPIVAALSNVGASDLVTFAIVIENTGRSSDGAFDVTFRDTFDATKFQIPSGGLNLQIRDGAGTLLPFTTLGTGLFDAAGGIRLDDGAGVGSLGPGKTSGGTVIDTGTNIAVITYDLQLRPNVAPFDVIPNTATLTEYASQEGGPNFIPQGLEDTTTVTVASPTVVKTLVSTSIVNANNSNTQAVIGELATYTITVTVPQGEMPTAQLIDSMPGGLAYVRTISAVNNNPATLTIPNLANLPTVTSNGQTITYDLGTIVNSDADPATDETFTITIEAVVLNVTGNVRGTTLVNQARTAWNAGVDQTSNVSSGAVTVIEPTLTVTKTASPTTGQAADTITYTIVVENPTGTNRTDAYNVTLEDVVPTGMTYVPGSWQNTAGTAPTTISAAGPLAATWDTFALEATSTFTFQATLDYTVTPAQQIVNEADAAWTSLPTSAGPGPFSTFNANSYERTGSGSTTLGQLNNYTATDDATVTIVSPTIAKALVSTSIVNANNSNTEAVIGETALYRLTITVPQGTMPTSTIVDTLPAGLAFVEVVGTPVVDPDITIQNADWFTTPGNLTVGTGGQTLTFNLGNVTNSDTNSSAADTIVVDIRAVVLNLTGNTSGTTLVNQAQAFWNAGANSTALASSEAVTVIEPTLTVTKTASPTTGQAGDTITYTIVVSNPSAGTNRTDAYNVTLEDVVPTGMTYVPGSWQNTAGTAPTTISAAGPLAATWDTFALEATSTFTFQATLDYTVTPAQQIVNEADAAWTSLPTSAGPGPFSTFNANSYERTGSGSTTLGQLNNYTATDDATVTIVSPTIAKALVSTSIVNANNSNTEAVIGETALYRLTITVPQGTMPTSTIVDTLPAGLAFVEVVGTPVVDPDITIQNADWFTTPGNLTVGTGGQTLTFNLGNVTNSDTNSSAADTIVVDIRAVVLNLTGNTSGTTLVNQAQAFWNAGANSTALVSAETVTVIEPDMEVDKTVSVGGGGGNVGDTVTYTIVIRQAAGSETDAFNVTLADTIPAQISAPTLTSVVDTSSLVTASAFSIVGNVLSTTGTGFSFAKIPGRTITLTVTGTIANTITPAQTITNSAAIQWTSLDGSPSQISSYNTNSYERTGSGSTTLGQLNDYAASDAAAFTTRSADLVVTKTVSNATPNVGDTITYLITVTNNGPDAATGVRMTDTFPTAGLEFVDADPSQGSYTEGTGLWNVGLLASGDSATLEIRAEVLPPPTPGVPPPTQTNVAVVTGNEPDPDPDNNRAEVDETPQYADLAVTKTVDVARPNVGANVVFTITVQNLGADAATNVRLSDPLPSGLQLVSATPSQGSYDPGTTPFGTGIWTVGTLPATGPGNTATLTIVATVLPPPSGGPPPAKTNVAAVSHSDQYDPNQGNNQDQVTVTPLYADVSVQKTVSDPAPYLGDTITYTIVVSNAGPDPAQTVSVTEAFPTAGLSNIVAGRPTLGSVTGSGGSFTWTVGTLESGDSATLTFTARTTAVGNFVNTVTASSTTYDPDSGDLTAQAQIDTQTGGVITGTDFGCESSPIVRVVDPRDGRLRSEFFAYEPSFRGGVRVYGADITGDGVPEILTAPGPGRPGEVRVFTREGVPLPQYNFMPFGAGFTSGVEVAAGSVTGAGRYEIVAGQSRGQGLVRVFTVNAGSVNSSAIRQFQPFGSRFRGGVTVATADVGTFSGANFVSNAPNDIAEIIVGSGAGIPAEVRAFNAVPATPARIGAFRVMGGSNRGVSVSKLPGATGVADRILVAGGQRSGGQVETWRQNGGQFVRDAAFAGFGGTSASVFAAALDAENIFTVEGVGGRTSGVRKNTAPSGGTSSAVPGTSTFRPPLRVAALRR